MAIGNGIGAWTNFGLVFYVLDMIEHCTYDTVIIHRKRHGRRRPQRFAGRTLKVGVKIRLPVRASHWVIETKRRA